MGKEILGLSIDFVLKQHNVSEEALYDVFFDPVDGSHVTHLNITKAQNFPL